MAGVSAGLVFLPVRLSTCLSRVYIVILGYLHRGNRNGSLVDQVWSALPTVSFTFIIAPYPCNFAPPGVSRRHPSAVVAHDTRPVLNVRDYSLNGYVLISLSTPYYNMYTLLMLAAGRALTMACESQTFPCATCPLVVVTVQDSSTPTVALLAGLRYQCVILPVSIEKAGRYYSITKVAVSHPPSTRLGNCIISSYTQVATPIFGYTAGAMVVLEDCVVSQGDTGS